MMNMMPAGESLANAPEVSGEYQRIGDVASAFGVSLRTLRFYEDKGLLSPRREGTTRLYGHRDVARLKLILFGRKVGFSLREVKQILDLYDSSGPNLRQLKVAIDKGDRQLGKLEKQRATIEEAIRELRSAMGSWRQNLTARQAPQA
jgi:DNA-binding transcriptional MerR regulator